TFCSVSCSCLAYPFTVSTKLGIRSYRRLSCTSIWAHASSIQLRSRTRELYCTIQKSATTTTTPSTIQTAMVIPPSLFPVFDAPLEIFLVWTPVLAAANLTRMNLMREIGRASCRDRGWLRVAAEERR